MYIYFGCDSIPDDFERFRRFRLDANGHTDIRTYGHTDGHMDGRKAPLTEMRGCI